MVDIRFLSDLFRFSYRLLHKRIVVYNSLWDKEIRSSSGEHRATILGSRRGASSNGAAILGHRRGASSAEHRARSADQRTLYVYIHFYKVKCIVDVSDFLFMV